MKRSNKSDKAELNQVQRWLNAIPPYIKDLTLAALIFAATVSFAIWSAPARCDNKGTNVEGCAK